MEGGLQVLEQKSLEACETNHVEAGISLQSTVPEQIPNLQPLGDSTLEKVNIP